MASLLDEHSTKLRNMDAQESRLQERERLLKERE